jgi:lipopolysaccharide export system permease protein
MAAASLILDRYLIREISRPLVVVCGILVVVFAGYSATVFLAEAASGLLGSGTVLVLIALKTLIALEVLLPISLYITVVVGMGRLYSDHEMTALSSSGVGPGRALLALAPLFALVAVVVGGLSLFARPWAYQRSYEIQARAESEFDVEKLEGGRFYVGTGSDRTLFAERIDRERGTMEGVFVELRTGSEVRVVRAKSARQTTDDAGRSILDLVDGRIYTIDRAASGLRVVAFDGIRLDLDPDPPAVGYKRKAAPTAALAHSDQPDDLAELQWRLSTPINTLVLGVLGFLLSRTAPRRGRFARMIAAIVVYAVYYNLTAVARSWVERGVLGAIPGIWWVDLLMTVGLVLLYRRPRPGFGSA